MNPFESIKSIAGGQKEQQMIDTMCIVMREYGLTLEELSNTPIPTYLFFIKQLEREAQQAKKANKR